MDYSNLREKTIFDFTNDEKILKIILGDYYFEEYLENKNQIISESKDWNLNARVSHLIEYSKISENNKLYESLKNEFDVQFPNEFRKVGDPFYFT